MAKKKDKIRISFIGRNSESVTGSCVLIEMIKYKILLEFGLYQSNNIKEDYKVNNRRLEFRPSEIDYIFVMHSHADHSLLLPRLYANGCKARIITPNGAKTLFSVMGMDSAHIMSRDVESLSRNYKMDVNPIYTAEDVNKTLNYFDEYGFDEVIRLNDSISFRFIPSGHIINAAQLELWLTEGNKTSKILYTSDIGNISVPKYYATEFRPVDHANVVIAETTYSDTKRSATMKEREKDLEKIKAVVETVCVDNKAKVLIPVFALDRAQNILTHLYDIFGGDSNFNIPVIVDSPLTVKITKLYESLLDGEQLEKFNEVMEWKNLNFVTSYEESLKWQNKKEPMILIAASGFMKNGRSLQWAKTLLPSSKNHILFVGYSSEGSLASRIKNGKNQKTISIDKKPVANRCGITSLNSFSSHIQRDDALKYYSDINCEKICLVHGEMKAKCTFGKDLQSEIQRKNKTSKVVIVNKSSEILL